MHERPRCRYHTCFRGDGPDPPEHEEDLKALTRFSVLSLHEYRLKALADCSVRGSEEWLGAKSRQAESHCSRGAPGPGCRMLDVGYWPAPPRWAGRAVVRAATFGVARAPVGLW